MLDLLLYCLLGIGCGTFCGLLPGIHPNNVIPVAVGLTAFLSLDPLCTVAFLVSAAISNTFVSYLPSTFLGVPEEGTALSVLPAHRLTREGRGYHALKISTAGCLFGLLFGLLLLVPFYFLAGPTYRLLKGWVPLILILIAALMILTEHSPRRMGWAILVFILSGLLGLVSLSGRVCSSDSALIPLFTGLFGLSTLLVSLEGTCKLPKQEIDDQPVRLNPKIMGIGGSIGAFMGMLPAVGPAQSTVVAQLATQSKGTDEFLFCVSEVNLLKVFYSFILLYLIGRARTGIAAAIQDLVQVNSTVLVLMIGASILAGGLTTLIVLRLGRSASSFIPKIPYRLLILLISCWVVGLTIYFCGPVGLPLLSTATAIGLLPPKAGVKRV
ncbi:MAG: tripartite tricarboxylate transporter permease, partial [Candidatus Hadarchaeales archaeon]